MGCWESYRVSLISAAELRKCSFLFLFFPIHNFKHISVLWFLCCHWNCTVTVSMLSMIIGDTDDIDRFLVIIGVHGTAGGLDDVCNNGGCTDTNHVCDVHLQMPNCSKYTSHECLYLCIGPTYHIYHVPLRRRSSYTYFIIIIIVIIIITIIIIIIHPLTATPEGRPGMSDVSPLSGIPGLSFDSTLPSLLLFFCLVLLLFLSYFFFLPAGPFSLNRSRKIFNIFFLKR